MPSGFTIVSAPTGSAHQRPTRLGNPEMHFSTDQLIGSAFIAFGLTLFVCFFYVAVVSKLLPPHQNGFLAAIQNDWYYCLLVPLTLPVIIVAVYLHWLSMKMFKHAWSSHAASFRFQNPGQNRGWFGLAESVKAIANLLIYSLHFFAVSKM